MERCPAATLVRLTTRLYLEQEDVEPAWRRKTSSTSGSGSTYQQQRGATSPLGDRGKLPQSARARLEGCWAARPGMLQGRRCC